ncbi:MAG TPA: hypothetical protein VFA67_08755 [Candidatus Sulfotelmatobacter sp.]|nr:hypothetical protein [Candidatus Sulfotelmatobacter sp.]
MGDDSAIYYVKQSGGTVWLAGMSVNDTKNVDKEWHRGIKFTHIFQGSYASASTVNGNWADVTRGSNLSFGSLSFSVDTSSGVPLLTRTSSTGNITPNTLSYETNPLDDSSWNGSTLDIVSRFDAVHKNVPNTFSGYESIEDNLKSYRDSSVFYGSVTTLALKDSSGNTQPSQPLVNYPNWATQDRGFDTFVCENQDGAGSKDGDMDISLTVDLNKLEPTFYTEGWGSSTLGPQIFDVKFSSALAHSSLGLDSGSAFLHIEALQYGRAGTCDNPDDDTYHYDSLLPGWSDSNGNSMLVNGRPVNGYLRRSSPLNDCDFYQPCPLFPDGTSILIGDAGSGQYNQITSGSYVRVIGTLVLDCGHSTLTNISPCFDELLTDPNDPYYWIQYYYVANNQNQEIHPIYSLDIINSPFRPDDVLVVNRVNLTGTWAGNDGSTYYVRQIGNTIWMFGQTRDKQPMQRGNSFPQIGDTALTTQFQAGDPACNSSPYQCWGFARVFTGTITEFSNGTGAQIIGQWAGVPQSSYAGSSGGSMTWFVDYTNKNLVPVASGVFPVLLQKIYEPSDTVPPQSYLSFEGAQYSANNQTFVNGDTLVRVNGTDSDSGVQNIWYRTFAQGATAPAYSPVLASSIGLFLSGKDGNYELDSYATDNAGNDETGHSNILYLDDTPPQAAILQPAATTYTHDTMLQLNYSVGDGAGSGVKSFTPTMDGALTLSDCTSLASGQAINLLTEMSLGTHTFGVSSFDNLGNRGTNYVTFTIVVTPASISADVREFLSAGKITIDSGTLLLQLLAAAARARAAGDCATATSDYLSFISKVKALSGKKIDPTVAQILIGDANYLIAHCP